MAATVSYRADTLEPSNCTAARMATEMPTPIRAYSMAVVPDSSLMKRATRGVMGGANGAPAQEVGAPNLQEEASNTGGQAPLGWVKVTSMAGFNF